jgi:large subunit ribosomal protein L21
MKAIIETGGKQYVVSLGDKINIEKIIAESSKEHIIEKVLLVKKDDGTIITGKPYIDNASVVAKVVDQFKDKKVKVFKLKRRKHYKKTIGHRQQLTSVEISNINIS